VFLRSLLSDGPAGQRRSVPPKLWQGREKQRRWRSRLWVGGSKAGEREDGCEWSGTTRPRRRSKAIFERERRGGSRCGSKHVLGAGLVSFAVSPCCLSFFSPGRVCQAGSGRGNPPRACCEQVDGETSPRGGYSAGGANSGRLARTCCQKAV